MTSWDKRRFVPPSDDTQGGEPPYAPGPTNPFSPVSTENRITGGAGSRRAPVETQPLPGSSYGYGYPEAEPGPPAYAAAPPYGFSQGAMPALPPLTAPPDPFYGVPASVPHTAAPASDPGYLPRHSRAVPEPLREVRPVAEPVTDPWETLGWKAPKAVLDGSAPSQRYTAQTPYGYAAYREPTAPYAVPPEAQPYAPGIFPSPSGRGEPTAVDAFSQPYAPAGPSPVAPFSPTEGGRSASDDRREATPPSGGQKGGHNSPPPARTTGGKPAPKGGGTGRTPRDWWRMALIVVLSLALLFCVIEVAKIVRDLAANEREVKESNDAYYSRMDADVRAAGGVELLPAGQTYAPVATVAPAKTPTPEPRIAQNDPLIGVMDGAGAATGAQTAASTGAPATRARLAYYPDNQLLSIDPAFDAMRAENADVVGILTIDGLLSETLVQRNNTYYLTHNARGAFGGGGAIFADEGCVLTRPPENLLLRGQTNVPGRLFAPLAQYETGGTDFVTRHGIVSCHTLYENVQYVVFAVLHADSSPASPAYFNYAGHPTFQTDAQMLAYVQAARQRSLYAIDVGVKASDRLLTLATLPEGSDTSCLVILCRMLRGGESAGHLQKE